MDFEQRLEAAHAELRSAGVWHSNYNPPIARLLRKVGVQMRPPYYQCFIINFFNTSLPFTVGFGVFGWFFLRDHLRYTSTEALMTNLLGGVAFGLCMSIFYLVRRKQLKLTRWDALESETKCVKPH